LQNADVGCDVTSRVDDELEDCIEVPDRGRGEPLYRCEYLRDEVGAECGVCRLHVSDDLRDELFDVCLVDECCDDVESAAADRRVAV
jgi:hypothetical protein